MAPVEILYWYVPVMLLVYLALGYSLVKRAGLLPPRPTPDDATARPQQTAHGDDDTDSRDSDVVACPNCGTENEAGYRFCGECIAELPTGRQIAKHRSTATRTGLR